MKRSIKDTLTVTVLLFFVVAFTAVKGHDKM